MSISRAKGLIQCLSLQDVAVQEHCQTSSIKTRRRCSRLNNWGPPLIIVKSNPRSEKYSEFCLLSEGRNSTRKNSEILQYFVRLAFWPTVNFRARDLQQPYHVRHRTVPSKWQKKFVPQHRSIAILHHSVTSEKCLYPHQLFWQNNPYPTAFPYGNGMVLHFYQQQESSTTKTVHKVINSGLKTYVQSLHTGENFH